MHFQNLAFDILFDIIRYIDPLDIIHLGHTCIFFYTLCKERAVWTTALRRIRKDNAVFQGLLSDSGGHSLDRLRREATAPARLVNLMKKSNESRAIICPKSSYIISSHNGEPFHSMRLVPGGKILLSASANSLCIWDLGKDSSHLVKSWNIPVKSLLLFSLINGFQDFRIAIASHLAGGGGSKTKISIIEYGTASSTTKTYEIQLDDWSFTYEPFYTWSTDCFFYIDKSVLHVWNFQVDKFFRWSVPYDDYLEIIVYQPSNLVILLSQTHVYCYDITSTIFTTHQSMLSMAPLRPKLTLEIPGNIPRDMAGDLVRQGLWYDHSHFPLLFDVMIERNDGVYAFWTLEICLPDSSNEAPRVEFISQDHLPYHQQEPTGNFDMVMYQYRVACGRIFKMFYDGVAPPCIKVAFRNDPRTPTDRFDDDPCIEADFLPPIPLGVLDDDDTAAAMDPASGRLCYVANDCSGIAVVDYLA